MSGLGVVLAAAGSSRRLGFDKLFTPVLGKTVFQFGLDRILSSPLVRQVVIVTSEHNDETVRKLLPSASAVPIEVVRGGAERQDSVSVGLAAIASSLDYVMIQDAARPFVTAELIEKVYNAAVEHGAAVCGHPSIDTLKVSEDGASISHTVDRDKIWAVQTPQIFSRQLLLDAYAAVAASGHSVTDDTAAVEALGRSVALVRHDGLNIKITRKADWEVGIPSLFPVENDIESMAHLRKLMHDFANQITSLLGFAYLIDADCPEDSPMKPSVNSLNESVQKCHEITLVLQKFARESHAKKVALQQGIQNPDNPGPGGSAPGSSPSGSPSSGGPSPAPLCAADLVLRKMPGGGGH